MPLLIADCPRCRANSVTFDVLQQVHTNTTYGWCTHFEIFSVCRNCNRPTIFAIKMTTDAHSLLKGQPIGGDLLMSFHNSINNYFAIDGYISLKDHVRSKPPKFLPDDIRNAFVEGATCFTVQCYNAAATMFRLCVDLVTRPLLPNDTSANDAARPNTKQRRDLGLRLQWLFENNRLDYSLKELAKCIREDSNDGAHVGNLSKEDAEDIMDFTTALLERLVTEPERLKQAEARRLERREPR
jgi:uncharacterized protein DUF4145